MTVERDESDAITRAPEATTEPTSGAASEASYTGPVNATTSGNGTVSSTLNDAFDVTPAHLVTALITDRGVCDASAEGLARLFPEEAGRGR